MADETDQYYTGRQENSNQDFLGEILSSKDGIITLTQRNYFEEGDKVDIFTPSGKTYTFVIDEVYDENLNRIGVARHPEEIIKIKYNADIEEHSMMRKSIDD